MILTLTVISYQRLLPDQNLSRVLHQGAMTIGRSIDSDWMLPDPERVLSKKHCRIEARGDSYWLTDTSQNGVFINQQEQPVGYQHSVELHDGDVVILGDYEIQVAIQAPPPASGPAPVEHTEKLTLRTDVIDVPIRPQEAPVAKPHFKTPEPLFDEPKPHDPKLLIPDKPPAEPLFPGDEVGRGTPVAATPADLSSPERDELAAALYVPSAPPSPEALTERASPAVLPESQRIPTRWFAVSEFPMPKPASREDDKRTTPNFARPTRLEPSPSVPPSASPLPPGPTPVSPTASPWSSPQPSSSPPRSSGTTPVGVTPSGTDRTVPLPADAVMEALQEITPPGATPRPTPDSAYDASSAQTEALPIPPGGLPWESESRSHQSPSQPPPVHPAPHIPKTPSRVPPHPAPAATTGTEAYRQSPTPPSHTPFVSPSVMSSAAETDNLQTALAALKAFWQGAGLPIEAIRPQTDPFSVLKTAGIAFRRAIMGIREALMARSAVKSELGLVQTSIRPLANNPLKFSVTTEEAILALLSNQSSAYLPPEQALAASFEDLHGHQVALVAGVQSALRRFAERLDPAAIEADLGPPSLWDRLFPRRRQARCWELLWLRYADIMRETEEDFQSLFGQAFQRAYNEQVRLLRERPPS